MRARAPRRPVAVEPQVGTRLLVAPPAGAAGPEVGVEPEVEKRGPAERRPVRTGPQAQEQVVPAPAQVVSRGRSPGRVSVACRPSSGATPRALWQSLPDPLRAASSTPVLVPPGRRARAVLPPAQAQLLAPTRPRAPERSVVQQAAQVWLLAEASFALAAWVDRRVASAFRSFSGAMPHAPWQWPLSRRALPRWPPVPVGKRVQGPPQAPEPVRVQERVALSAWGWRHWVAARLRGAGFACR